MKVGCTLVVAIWLAASAAMAADTGEAKLGEFIPEKPPQPAPEISFTDLDGNSFNLGVFRNKLVLVNLWATWCEPCLREMPSLAALKSKMGDGLALLAISEDRGGAKVVQPFLDKLGLDKLFVYLDPKSDVGHAFEVRGLPTSVVIGPKGTVLGRVEGAADWESPEMLAVLQPLLPSGAGNKGRVLKGAWR
jgi:thiol-disulfide isomerase/thioredoxin